MAHRVDHAVEHHRPARGPVVVEALVLAQRVGNLAQFPDQGRDAVGRAPSDAPDGRARLVRPGVDRLGVVVQEFLHEDELVFQHVEEGLGQADLDGVEGVEEGGPPPAHRVAHRGDQVGVVAHLAHRALDDLEVGEALVLPLLDALPAEVEPLDDRGEVAGHRLAQREARPLQPLHRVGGGQDFGGLDDLLQADVRLLRHRQQGAGGVGHLLEGEGGLGRPLPDHLQDVGGLARVLGEGVDLGLGLLGLVVQAEGGVFEGVHALAERAQPRLRGGEGRAAERVGQPRPQRAELDVQLGRALADGAQRGLAFGGVAQDRDFEGAFGHGSPFGATSGPRTPRGGSRRGTSRGPGIRPGAAARTPRGRGRGRSGRGRAAP